MTSAVDWLMSKFGTNFARNSKIYIRMTFLCQLRDSVTPALEFRKRKSRSHSKRQKGNDKRKRCAAQKSNTFINDLSTKLRDMADMQCFHFLVPYLFQSYAYWI